jgi:hypothetical protein
MTPTIRTSDPRELLALVPFQLGFVPQESAVVVGVRPPRGQVGLVARVDLGDLADPRTGPDVARMLVAHLANDGAEFAVLVLYTALDLQQHPAVGDEVAALLGDAARGVLQLQGCWVVGPAGFYGLGCVDPGCCPPGGRGNAELESAQIGAEMVLLGATVAPSRAELAALPAVPATARRSARRAAQRWRARAVAAGASAAAHRWRRESLALWVTTLADDTAGLEPTVAGRLAAGLADVLVRDAVLLGLVEPGPRLGDRVVAGHGGRDVDEALRRVVDPDVGERPDPDRAERARQLLQLVAAHAPGPMVAAPVTLLALLSWWEGDGARASVLVERALAADEEHRLARLLDETIAVGMAPGWVRRRSA